MLQYAITAALCPSIAHFPWYDTMYYMQHWTILDKNRGQLHPNACLFQTHKTHADLPSSALRCSLVPPDLNISVIVPD